MFCLGLDLYSIFSMCIQYVFLANYIILITVMVFVLSFISSIYYQRRGVAIVHGNWSSMYIKNWNNGNNCHRLMLALITSHKLFTLGIGYLHSEESHFKQLHNVKMLLFYYTRTQVLHKSVCFGRIRLARRVFVNEISC